MDYSKWLARCSSLGEIMADARGSVITPKQLETITELLEKQKKKPLTAIQERDLADLITKRDTKPELGATCKTHLVEVYIREQYGRENDVTNKYLEKGIVVEQSSTTLYSQVTNKWYRINEERISNDFITGKPDIYLGDQLVGAHTIKDIKSSYDLFTFFAVLHKPISKLYEWQLLGYSGLTGAQDLGLVYCLVDMPEILFQQQEWKLFYKLNPTTRENPLYKEASEALRRLYQYDDIEPDQRVIEFQFKRDVDKINAIYSRVPLCRKFLQELDDRITRPGVIYATS